MISDPLQFLSVINGHLHLHLTVRLRVRHHGGRSGIATTTVDYYTYITTFENGQFGYGAALALLLFLIVLTLTIAQVKLFPNKEVQQGS